MRRGKISSAIKRAPFVSNMDGTGEKPIGNFKFFETFGGEVLKPLWRIFID